MTINLFLYPIRTAYVERQLHVFLMLTVRMASRVTLMKTYGLMFYES